LPPERERDLPDPRERLRFSERERDFRGLRDLLERERDLRERERDRRERERDLERDLVPDRLRERLLLLLGRLLRGVSSVIFRVRPFSSVPSSFLMTFSTSS